MILIKALYLRICIYIHIQLYYWKKIKSVNLWWLSRLLWKRLIPSTAEWQGPAVTHPMQLPPVFLSLPDLPVCRILPHVAKCSPNFMFIGEQYLANPQNRQGRAMPNRINTAFLQNQKQQPYLCHWAVTGRNKGKFAEAKISTNRKFWLYMSSAICSAAPARLSGKLPDFPKKL